MAPPRVGEPAPAFSLPDQNGEAVRLSDLAGATSVLLVFYPFAFSGICTAELREIRDQLDDFTSAGVQVMAISCDPMYALRAWAEQEGYDFPLLADFWPHGAVSATYGVFDGERGHPVRGSFLIDRDGVLRWSVLNGPGEPRDMGAYRDAVAALPAA